MCLGGRYIKEFFQIDIGKLDGRIITKNIIEYI